MTVIQKKSSKSFDNAHRFEITSFIHVPHGSEHHSIKHRTDRNESTNMSDPSSGPCRCCRSTSTSCCRTSTTRSTSSLLAFLLLTLLLTLGLPLLLVLLLLQSLPLLLLLILLVLLSLFLLALLVLLLLPDLQLVLLRLLVVLVVRTRQTEEKEQICHDVMISCECDTSEVTFTNGGPPGREIDVFPTEHMINLQLCRGNLAFTLLEISNVFFAPIFLRFSRCRLEQITGFLPHVR